MWGLGQELEKPELWLPPGGREELAAFGTRFGTPDMFIRVFEPKEYAEGEEFEAAGLRLVATRLPHYTVQTFGFRVSNRTRTLAYSGDSGPSERLARLAEGVDLFLCEATLERGELDGEPRGHLSAEEAVAAFEASGAKRLLLTHRPKELSRQTAASSRLTTASSSTSESARQRSAIVALQAPYGAQPGGPLRRGWRVERSPPRVAREGRATRRAQKTGVSRQTPQTSRSASHISPIVTYARDASTISGIRLPSSFAASSFSAASAASTAAESRRARSACTRSICLRSSAGSMRRISIGASSSPRSG